MTRSTLTKLRQELQSLADPQRAEHSLRFFKTGKGEYGEGDRFLGIAVPRLRQLAKKYHQLPPGDAEKLLQSPWHEARLTALLLLMQHYKKGNPTCRQQIFQCYLRNTHKINNWDLVDISAPHIVGAHLQERRRDTLNTLVRSENLWERRIAIVSSHHFIRQGDFKWTLQLAQQLLEDKEDLIHKAVGWMLREVGKRDQQCEESFLHQYYLKMPRTMLRYAIERFPEKTRKAYLQGLI